VFQEVCQRDQAIQDARAHYHAFFIWYNTEHHHSSLGLPMLRGVMNRVEPFPEAGGFRTEGSSVVVGGVTTMQPDTPFST
jgi:hypothetical protein